MALSGNQAVTGGAAGDVITPAASEAHGRCLTGEGGNPRRASPSADADMDEGFLRPTGSGSVQKRGQLTCVRAALSGVF